MGTLYLGLDTENPLVISYSPVFMARRSLFTLLAFKAFNYPGPQVQIFLHMSLFYLIYVTLAKVHSLNWQRHLEIVNEMLLYLMSLHFLYFTIPKIPAEQKSVMTKTFLTCMFTLIGINTLVIFRVTYLGCKKSYLVKKRKKELAK